MLFAGLAGFFNADAENMKAKAQARRAAEAAARALRELENAYNRLVRATREMPGKITDGFSKLSTLKNEIVSIDISHIKTPPEKNTKPR